MNGSELVDDYLVSPSPVYTGSGTSTLDFTITLGNDVHVDRLRIQVWNDDQTELLDEQFETVDYHFVSTLVEITEISPSNITTLLMGEKITVKFKFKTVVTDGIRIFVRPVTAGALSPSTCGRSISQLHNADWYKYGGLYYQSIGSCAR